MIRRLFSGSANSSITGAAVIIGAAALASRILGVLRDRILAGEFGAGATLDQYYAAFRIPDLVYNLLVLGALSAGFIPVFVKYRHNAAESNRLANSVLHSVVLGVGLLSIILALAAEPLVKLITPGFDTAALAITVRLSRIMFLSPLLLGISAVWGGILQSEKRFFAFSLAPVLYNVGIMIGAVFLVSRWGVDGLAWGVVLGAGLHMLVQLPAIWQTGWRYQPVLAWRHAGLREIWTLMIPRTFSLAVSQVNVLVMNGMASMLAVGSIAAWQLANNLQSFPLGIFGVSFAIAAFPTLSAHWADHDAKGFITSFSRTARQILFFTVPLSALFIILRAQITRAALGAGQFDWTDTIRTADTLALFCVSLFAQSLIPLLARGLYALHNTLTPFWIGLVAVAANIGLALLLLGQKITIGTLDISGVTGLALAFSLSSILQVGLLWMALHFSVGGLDERRVLWAMLKISLATVVLGGVTQWLKYAIEPFTGTSTFVGIFSQGLIAGVGGLVAFVAMSWLLRSEELFNFMGALTKRFVRKAAVVELEGEV